MWSGHNRINSFTAKSVLDTWAGPRPDARFQLFTSVRWDLYSKTTISPTRGRDNFNSSLQPPSILSIPYPQVLVQSYEFAWAVFFNNKFESKKFTQRNYALLMSKIDGDNHYHIKQALRSYCLLVLSSHWYLKRITAAKTRRDQEINILLLFLALRKNLHVERVISEESLEIIK